MAKSPTESSRYQSRFGGGWVSASQFLAELACERASPAKLPLRFWNEKAWAKKYAHQARLAAALLKAYSPEAVMRALRTPRGKKILSLGARWLHELCAAEQDRLDRELAAASAPTTDEAAQPPTTTGGGAGKAPGAGTPGRRPASPLGKLREMERGQEEGGG